MSLPPHVRAMCDVSMEIVGRQTFGVAFADGDAAIAAYRRRTEEVRATIAPERLLVFDVAEGWDPLCRFLGVPEPDSPFPHHNTTAEFWEIVKGAPH